MMHTAWAERPTLRSAVCQNVDAKKFSVSDVLTVGRSYDVKNETEEFLFVVDDTGLVGGYYKHYFA